MGERWFSFPEAGGEGSALGATAGGGDGAALSVVMGAAVARGGHWCSVFPPVKWAQGQGWVLSG